jgi:hypothetical protein
MGFIQVCIKQGNKGKIFKKHGHKKDPVSFLLEKQDRRKITVLGVFVKRLRGSAMDVFFKNLQTFKVH